MEASAVWMVHNGGALDDLAEAVDCIVQRLR